MTDFTIKLIWGRVESEASHLGSSVWLARLTEMGKKNLAEEIKVEALDMMSVDDFEMFRVQ